jgi:hypothetical protein
MSGQPIITRGAADDLALGANGSYSNEGNALQHTLYDTARFSNTTMPATTNFFTQPIGAAYGAGGVKTLIETNLQDPGKLPNGQTFLIKEMSIVLKLNMPTTAVQFVAGEARGIENLLNGYYTMQENSTWEIKIAGREFDFQLPGSEFIPCIHAVGASSSSTRSAVRLCGDVLTSGWVKLRSTPIPIGQLVTFQVRHLCGSVNSQAILNAATTMMFAQAAEYQVRLRGMLTRSI